MPSLPLSLSKYFKQEATGSFVLAGIGLFMSSLGAYLYFDHGVMQDMGYPLSIIGIVQLILGINAGRNALKYPQKLSVQMENNYAIALKAELIRLKKIWQIFTLLKYLEIIAAAMGVYFMVFETENDQLYSIGLGLGIQASVMLVHDLFAEGRMKIYQGAINEALTS